ncbi:Ldh family oxidoreductase [Microvirga sp. BT689]|uniref:Ldh family oxidoreductase n=1 Tax=Microvirga arvi TaxID=2778731 RepID=UPI00194DDF2D|nr:Ldh family oxidoreductase [Microvirga arvi]MBM6581905.1 Ldh family oxidoreductase [Microvirga arvi]
MTVTMICVDPERLRRFALDAFQTMGLDSEQAAISAHALMYSELRFHPGQGQGVRRLRAYRDRIAQRLIDPAGPFTIVKESPALALVDACNGLGSVTGVRAMRLAVAKAKECGIGSVLVRGGTHYGSSAVHTAEAVEADCIGLAMTNAGPEMAPWGGATAVVGTNPWSIAAPTDRGFPVSLDIALTTAGKGMMRWYAREGRKMPLDWALTPEGEETDDPAAAMTGALLGIGQYKGYGLSFMTDAMTGVLSGGAFGTQPYSDLARQDVSHLFLAFDIAWFLPVAEYRSRMGRFIDMIKASRLRPGYSEVLVPGEIEDRRAREKLATGVPLDREVFEDLNELGRELGLSTSLKEAA